eukprot:1714463-Rhodomonas_salina.2
MDFSNPSATMHACEEIKAMRTKIGWTGELERKMLLPTNLVVVPTTNSGISGTIGTVGRYWSVE